MQTDTKLPEVNFYSILAISEHDGKAMLRAIIKLEGDDPDAIPLEKLSQLAGRLTAIGHPARPWSAKYLRNVSHGTQPASRFLLNAMERIALLDKGASQLVALGHNVTVLAMGQVTVGSILQVDSRECPVCHTSFIPRSCIPQRRIH